MGNLPKIGVDIGSASVKLVELLATGKDKWRLLGAATAAVPAGGMIDSPSNQAAVSATMIKMMKESGVRSRKTVVALPEEQISSHIVEMPLLSDTELGKALQWQVEQYIPIPLEQAIWSYQVIRRDTAGNGGMEVLLVATSKNLVSTYQKVLEEAGLEVVAVETELMATARAVVPAGSPLTVVVDIGARSTDVGVVSANQLVFARTVPTAGEAFTRAIETTLGLDTGQAEQYKNAYGFSAQSVGGKLVEAMKPVLAIIATEVKKTIDFYVSKHPQEMVKEVTLSGGVAAMPDVVSMVSLMLGIEVGVGNPFARVAMDETQKKAMSGNGPFYAVAAGLAMRE